jgi:hypothetical protein
MKERTEVITLIAVSIISSLLLYIPFALNVDSVFGVKLWDTGLPVLERYYDGPLYVVVSQTFYAPTSPLYSAVLLPASYYAAHLPGYPVAIWLFSLALQPFVAMLVANLVISAAAVVVFYFLIARFRLVHDPFSSGLLFLFFPPRWFLYRSVGASEPLFILLTLMMLYFVKKDEATKSTILGAFATLTRIWGVITFPVLIATWLWNKKLTLRRFALALAIPTSMVLLFLFYAYSFGNFFAYFDVNQSLLNIPLLTIPRTTLMGERSSAFGAELYVILFFIYGIGIVQLYQKGYKELFFYALFMFVPVLFVLHEDISRYLLPITPVALIIGCDDLMPKKRIHFLIPLALLCIAGYLYCLTVLPTNLLPLDTFERLSQAIQLM